MGTYTILSHLHVNCQLGFQLWDICNWYYTTEIVITISIYKIQKAFISFIFFSFYSHSATGMKNEISQFHFPNIAIQHYKYSKLQCLISLEIAENVNLKNGFLVEKHNY